MVRAIEPSTPTNGGYVVPLPRITDALGKALRRAFGPPPEADFADLMRRLDGVR